MDYKKQLFIYENGVNAKPSNIDEDLYLGCIDSALNLEALESIGIKRIITLDNSPLDHNRPDISYLFIKVFDNPHEDLLSRFEECYRFIRDGVLMGDKVLVHCVAGVSRSATIVVSYLMIKNSMTFEDAIDLVEKKRPFIDPNYGFRDQLKLFERMGTKVDAMNREYRLFLCNNLRHKVLISRPWNRPQSSGNQTNQTICEPLTHYFKKLKDFMPENSLNQRPEDVYKCKKCRLYLFNGINVLKNNVERVDQPKDYEVCNSIYTEPLNLMLPSIMDQITGLISCTNCFTKLGNFSWNSFVCNCIFHKDLNCLMFKIDAKKVDSPVLKLTDN